MVANESPKQMLSTTSNTPDKGARGWLMVVLVVKEHPLVSVTVTV